MSRYLVLVGLAVAMVARGEAQTTELPCGSPPNGTVPGVPVSNVHEPLPGANVCRGTTFEQVQEIIWICDTLLCCEEPCSCDAGHHSEQDHGCGDYEPIANISCYVMQQLPIRWFSRVCCAGYEEDDNRMCIPTIDCGAPGGSICEQLCVVDDDEHTCACRDGNQLINRTHCSGSATTTAMYTTTTTVSTTALPTTPTTTTTTTTTTDTPDEYSTTKAISPVPVITSTSISTPGWFGPPLSVTADEITSLEMTSAASHVSEETSAAPDTTEKTSTAPGTTEKTSAAPYTTEKTSTEPDTTEKTSTEPDTTEKTSAAPDTTEKTSAAPASPQAGEKTSAAPDASEMTTTEPTRIEQHQTSPASRSTPLPPSSNITGEQSLLYLTLTSDSLITVPLHPRSRPTVASRKEHSGTPTDMGSPGTRSVTNGDTSTEDSVPTRLTDTKVPCSDLCTQLRTGFVGLNSSAAQSTADDGQSTTPSNNEPSVAPTSTTTDKPNLEPQAGDPNQEPVVYDDGDNNLGLILGIVIPLILLLLLLLLLCLCCRSCLLCKKKPPATPRESIDAAFTNRTYGVLAAQEVVSDRALIIPDTPEKKKVPLDDMVFENDGYMAAVPFGHKPPPYSEKDLESSADYCGPDPAYFNEKVPIGSMGAPVVTPHNMKCPLPEVSASPLHDKKPALSDADFVSVPLTAVPNEYMEIPMNPTQRGIATEQNEVNEIHENIYCEIPGSHPA